MENIEIYEMTLPAYWASALINGDISGFEDYEEKAFERFTNEMLESYKSFFVVDCGEQYFATHSCFNYFESGIRGGDVCDYIFHIVEK